MPSTSVRWFRYDPSGRTLDLEYVGGGTYRYFGVDPASYRGLERALSKGRYVNFRIKPVFPYSRLA